MATNRLSAEQIKGAENVLKRLDKLAFEIQTNFSKWGMPKEAAKGMVNHLDKVADSFEAAAFGEDSLHRRQAEMIKQKLAKSKTAEVLQSESDEPYMKSFVVDQGIVQSESDEPYMQAYADDQSSAVRHGVSTTNKPLAP